MKHRFADWEYDGVEIAKIMQDYDHYPLGFVLFHSEEADVELVERLAYEALRRCDVIGNETHGLPLNIETRWWRWVRDFGEGYMYLEAAKPKTRGAFYATYAEWDRYLHRHQAPIDYPAPLPELQMVV